MDKIDPGLGYRLLEVGERKPEGYEVHQPDGTWFPGEYPKNLVRENQSAMRIKLYATPAQEVSIFTPKSFTVQALIPTISEASGELPLEELEAPISKESGLPLGARLPKAPSVREFLDEWTPKPFTPNKYTRDLLSLDGRRVPVDVYSVLAAFPTENAAVDHAIKKLLAPGQRGQKSRLQDLKESRASLDRAIQMEEG